jgi:uncharacterized membrane protein YtjA (UPF0391 family)
MAFLTCRRGPLVGRVPALRTYDALERMRQGGCGVNKTQSAPIGDKYMLSWTLTFLVIALIAGLLGFTGVAGTAAGIAQILFVVFLVFFLVSLITGRRSV